eukprot:3083225-Rhodomonas_salina.1
MTSPGQLSSGSVPGSESCAVYVAMTCKIPFAPRETGSHPSCTPPRPCHGHGECAAEIVLESLVCAFPSSTTAPAVVPQLPRPGSCPMAGQELPPSSPWVRMPCSASGATCSVCRGWPRATTPGLLA